LSKKKSYKLRGAEGEGRTNLHKSAEKNVLWEKELQKVGQILLRRGYKGPDPTGGAKLKEDGLRSTAGGIGGQGRNQRALGERRKKSKLKKRRFCLTHLLPLKRGKKEGLWVSPSDLRLRKGAKDPQKTF